MPIVRTLFPFLVFASAIALQAQSTVPTITQAIPAQSLLAGGMTASIDLRNYFAVPGVTGQVVQFDTVSGKFNVEMLASAAPTSVTNFLSYVGNKSYTSTIIHRSAALGGGTANRIVQGGGFTSALGSVTTAAPIALEYNLPNTRGTIAMARTTDLNSATSQWFFNVDDNTTALGTSNGGGYAVFGRVIGTGMSVVDTIAAVPVFQFSSPYDSIPLLNYTQANYQAGQSATTANLVVVNSVTAVPIYPAVGLASVIGFSGSFTAGGSSLVSGSLTGPMLSLTPLASGNTALTVNATDTNGNAVSSTFTITVAAAPVFSTQPASEAVAAGQTAAFIAAATASTAPTYQWQFNGANLSGITGSGFSISNVQPGNAGLYTAVATSGVSATSAPAILGVTTTSEVIGAGTVLGVHVQHPNGNYYDQILPTGAAESVTTPGYTVRTSFIDDNDDIVQVEFAGHGTLSLVLDSASGPALPVNYSQNQNYVKGHAGIVITGADETTNVLVFTVGRATAFDPTGGFNILQAISTTNSPANNGSPLFVGHTATTYDGIADIAFIVISSTNGKFGGLRASNTRFSATRGLTGVYAPGVAFTGPVYVGDIHASGTASPVLIIGSTSDARITGGNLFQPNGQPVQVSNGLTKLTFTPGGDSQGTSLPEYYNQSVLMLNGSNVNSTVVAYQ